MLTDDELIDKIATIRTRDCGNLLNQRIIDLVRENTAAETELAALKAGGVEVGVAKDVGQTSRKFQRVQKIEDW